MLEELDDAHAAIEPRLRAGVEIGTKLGEGGQLAELRQVEFNFTRDLFDRFDLRRGTDTADRETNRNGRAHALVEQISLQINLTVGDRDHVGRDVSGNVACLRFDDGQRGQGTAARFFGHARAALKQAGVEIENVAGIGFATGRTLQDQRHLAIGDRMFREIIVNDERVHSIIHEPLAHGGTGKGREILVRGGVGCRRGDDRRVRHGAVGFEDGERAGDVRVLLADGDVDAIKRPEILQLSFLAGPVQFRLADDGIERDRGFAGGAIADDELALPAADRNHRVDGHDARLHRLIHTPALDHAGRDFFQGIGGFRFDRAFPIQRLADRIHDPAEERFADGDLEQFTGGADLIAFHHPRGIAENDGADFRLLEVERETENTAGEFDHLVQHDVAQAFDSGHAVAGIADDADVALAGRGFQAGDLRFDVFKNGAHIKWILKLLLEALEPIAHAAVPHIAPDADAHPAEQLRSDDKPRGKVAAVFPLQVLRELPGGIRRHLGRALDRRTPFFHLEAEQTFVGVEDPDVISRLLRDQSFDELVDSAAIKLPIGKAGAEKLPRNLAGLFVDLHALKTRRPIGGWLLPEGGADRRCSRPSR